MSTLNVTKLEIRDRKMSGGSWREFTSKPRCYVFPKGETVLENLFVGRRNRPVDLYRTDVVPIVADEVARFLRINGHNPTATPDQVQLRWSRKAGCSCGCSPGFIVTIDGYSPRVDVFVDVEAADDAAAVVPEAREALDDFRAVNSKRSGRSGQGNLRNFGAMTYVKLATVAAAVLAEDNDPEALETVKAELQSRR